MHQTPTLSYWLMGLNDLYRRHSSTTPGALLICDAAGPLNVPKIRAFIGPIAPVSAPSSS
jgi:hypothetical protein